MNLFELFVKIGVDDQASGKLKDIGGKLGKGLKTAAKIGTAAIGAAATGISVLTTEAVNSFAEYEQLAGGAQKIFDQMDYSKIATDANNAYKELGLSANQYLAVINDVGATFAATMGDEAGYEAAKTGLKAISDYASGTGKNVDELSQKFTLITRSTSSYQSIADQFSGILPATSAGFLEQAQAAGILSDKYTQLTQVPIEEYQAAVSQMLQQGVSDLGLANNTMDEAFSTLSGSLSMAKGAWSNLVTGLADDSADLDMLIGNFVESVGAVATNLIPKIGTALNGVAKIIGEIAPQIVSEIPAILSSLLPHLVGAAEGLIGSVVSVLPSLVDVVITSLLPQLIKAVLSISDALVSALPSVISAITSALPSLVEQLLLGAIDLVVALCENLPLIIEPIISMLPDLLTSVLTALLGNLDVLVEGLIGLVVALIPMIPQILNILLDALLITFTEQWASALLELIPVLIVGLGQLIVALCKALPGLLLALVKVILQPFIQAYIGITKIFLPLLSWFNDNIVKPFVKIGKNIVDGMKSGISNAWKNLVSWFKGLFGDLIGIAKKILGIASPSKVFKKIGGFTAEGFGAGFEDEFAHVKDDMEDALNFDDASVGINASIRKVGAGAAGGAFGGTSIGNITINIDGAKYSDEQSLASAIALEIQNMTDRRAAVYA